MINGKDFLSSIENFLAKICDLIYIGKNFTGSLDAMKKSATYEELVKTLQKVTGTEFKSLMSLYFALDKNKFDRGILAFIESIAFDEEARRENIQSNNENYQEIIDYFKNYSK